MHSALRPFLFDRCFDDPNEPAAAGLDELPLAMTYSDEDLARARAEGFIEGKRLAEAATAESLDLRRVVAIERLAETLRELRDTLPTRDDILRDLTTVSLVIVRRFLSGRRAAEAAEEIAAWIETILPDVLDQPRLSVRFAPEVGETLQPHLAEIAERLGFTGDLQVRTDATLEPTDCRIEWHGGGVIRDTRQLWATLQARLGELVGTAPDRAEESTVDTPKTDGGLMLAPAAPPLP